MHIHQVWSFLSVEPISKCPTVLFHFFCHPQGMSNDLLRLDGVKGRTQIRDKIGAIL